MAAPEVLSANEQAYLFVRARILDGTYKAGELISEGEVAEAIGKSRTPVREAFLRLQGETLLRLFPKRGALVTALTPAEAAEVLEARGLIESWAAASLLRLSDIELHALVQTLRDELDEQRAAVRTNDSVTFQESDRDFHIAIVAAAGNSVITATYASLRDRLLRIGLASVYGGRTRSEEILRQHAAIVDALPTRDAARLRRESRAHIDATLAAIGLAPLSGEPAGVGSPADSSADHPGSSETVVTPSSNTSGSSLGNSPSL